MSLNLPQIVRIARTVLQYERIRRGSLSIVFVTALKIRNLNREYLKRGYATDVLAFDLKEGKKRRDRSRPVPARRTAREIIGDIVISADAAIQNGKAYKTSTGKEIVLYLIHGILHLLGFDDHAPRDIQIMRKKEQKILNYLGNKIDTVLR